MLIISWSLDLFIAVLDELIFDGSGNGKQERSWSELLMKDVAGEEGLIPPDLHYTDFEKYFLEIQLRNTFGKYS